MIIMNIELDDNRAFRCERPYFGYNLFVILDCLMSMLVFVDTRVDNQNKLLVCY